VVNQQGANSSKENNSRQQRIQSSSMLCKVCNAVSATAVLGVYLTNFRFLWSG